jgi:hypothetical protein
LRYHLVPSLFIDWSVALHDTAASDTINYEVMLQTRPFRKIVKEYLGRVCRKVRKFSDV